MTRRERRARPLNRDLRVLHVIKGGYVARWKHLRFIVVEELHGGRWWLHASVSRRDRNLPTYDDLKACKRLTIGDDRVALQVFPLADKHIDIAGPLGIEVLHLWSPDKANLLPDFTLQGTI